MIAEETRREEILIFVVVVVFLEEKFLENTENQTQFSIDSACSGIEEGMVG